MTEYTLHKHRYVKALCSSCGAERNVRIVKGEPISKLCQSCSVRTPQYRAKMAQQTRLSYARGDRE